MMTKSILPLGVLLFCSLSKLQAADAVYENFGTLTSVPQVDATTFINHGLFSVATILPYETQNTLHFSNLGIMRGNPGFRFDYVTPNGIRRPAADFLNGVDGRILATSGSRFLLGTAVTNAGITYENAQIIVSATNIQSRGQLHSDARGLVRLHGNKVDVSRSSIGILPFVGGFGVITPTNFIPEVGIFDVYWGMNGDGTQVMPLTGLVSPIRTSTNVAIQTPLHLVTNESQLFGFPTSIGLTNASAYVLTNAVTPTNWLIQAVFVQVQDPEITFDVRFFPGGILTNQYKTAVVEFTNLETNVLAGGFFTNQVYLIDRVAWETNFLELTNLTTLTTFRPSNYEVTRLFPAFAAGLKSNATNAPALILNPTYTNTIVTNLYSAYAFNVTNVAGIIPRVAGASITNLPGRVEIRADDLNIDRSRIRAEGIVTVGAKSLTSLNSVIDVQNIALDLGAPVQPLLIKSLVSETIDRTTGNIYAWSAMWTNQTGFLSTNSIPDPNNPGGMTNEVVTNVVDVGFHVLVVDGTQVQTRQAVYVPSLTLHSRHVTIEDTLRVLETLLIESESMAITATGKLILTNLIPDLNRSHLPNLTRLTNEGQIYLLGTAEFGTGRGRSYASIVNRGTITAFSERFRTEVFENTGTITANAGPPPPGSGVITIEAGFANLGGGGLEAGGPIRLSANDLRIRNTTIKTAQPFTLNVTNSLTDGGSGASNIISSEGFHLLSKPPTGDLLGTTFQSTAPSFLEVPHTWAGLDRGATAAGFVNNMAIGSLILTNGLDTLYTFRGVSATGNALYVRRLELRGVPAGNTNAIRNLIKIDDGFKIYFESTSTNVTAADLRIALGDRVAQVASAAVSELPPSGSNQTGRGAGAALSLAVSNAPPAIAVSWAASPGTVYKVEYTTNLLSPSWKLLMTYTNASTLSKTATVQDGTSDQKQRFYRVRADQ